MVNPYQQIYEPMAQQIAGQYGIPSNIFTALIGQESGWNPYAIGTSGEYGLTQLMDATAASVNASDYLYDPSANMQGGAAFLSSLYKKYGNWQDALAAYNAGTPSSSAGQSYAQAVLKAAGASGTAAPASGGAWYDPSTWPNWLKSVADLGIMSGGGPAGVSVQADQTKKDVAATAADATSGWTQFVSWLGGPGIVFIIAGVGIIAVTYLGVKALFESRDK
jgi:hypothetical protein